jgi:tyrosine-protein kinase Etk/Wzc
MSDSPIENQNQIGLGGQFDIGLLLQITSKTIPWIILIFILSIGSAFTYLYYTQREYQSTSVIQIVNENQANRILNVGDIYEDADISKDIELLRSPVFFKRVIEDLPLDVSYYVEGEVLDHENYLSNNYEVKYDIQDLSLYNQRIYIDFLEQEGISIEYYLGGAKFFEKSKLGDTIQNEHLTLSVTARNDIGFDIESGVLSEDRQYFVINSTDKLVNNLRRKYRIVLQNASAKTVLITVIDNNPRKASDICAAVADQYLLFDIERKSESANKVLEFINQQIEDVYAKLKISEDLITDFKQRTRLAEKKEISSTYIQRVNILEREKTEIELKINLLDELKNNINAEKTGVDIYSLLPVLAGTEFEKNVEQHIEELQKLVMNRNRILGTATIENPNVILYNQRIEMQKNLILKSLAVMSKRLIAIKGRSELKIKSIEDNFLDLPTREIEYARLERVFNSHEKYYTMLLEKKTEFSISKAGLVPENTILQKATPSRVPISPKKSPIYSIFLAFSFLISIVAIAARYILHNDIDVGDLGALLHAEISVLGIIPKYQKSLPNSQMIVDKKPKSSMAEAFRSIRTNLEFFEAKDEKKVIAVTSTISGEGKTFVVLNLGGILAISGKKVVILDLDMRRPRIHEGFGSDNEKGMSTVLSSRDNVHDVIRKSELDDLHFITAGPIPPNPSELIINGKLQETVEELKKTYDIILIDNPPVGLVTDGISCLRMADYPIYIFRSDYSKKSFAANVNRVFKENKIKNLSVILNGVDLEGNKYRRYGSGYGSKYGYGYGYGYGYVNTGNSYYQED